MHSSFPLRLEDLSPLAIPIAEASYNLPETSPLQIPSIPYPSFVASSSLGPIQVYGITPREGEQGVPITYLAHDYPRRHRRGSFRRARTSHSGESHTARLEFRTPLTDICTNWEESEIIAGRRLVYFSSEQRNNTLEVSCSAIAPEKLSSHDVVVSCIYQEDLNQCFITSVDIIFLLQRLVGEQFTVMEKNRIRRNLEGFRPITVSKHRAGVSEFFQKIMDFPDPKPRNIEKDLKVFPWHCLDQALNKIISKYVRFCLITRRCCLTSWYVVVKPRSRYFSIFTTTTTRLQSSF
jgi:hypothetical protein